MTDRAFLPEAFAYERHMQDFGWNVDLISDEADAATADVVVRFMGIHPIWQRRGGAALVHEYHSLPTGKLPRLKTHLKRLFNHRPQGLIFLNRMMQEQYGFPGDIPAMCREMGVDRELFFSSPPPSPQYDLVYCGSERQGLFGELDRLGKLGLKVLLVGDFKPDTVKGELSNVELAGRVSRKELPSVIRLARAGLNYTPDVYPLNCQTSTKTIEYAAAGIGIVSNQYEWIDKFATERNARILWSHKIKSASDFYDFVFEQTNVSDLEWSIVLDQSGLLPFILKIRESA